MAGIMAEIQRTRNPKIFIKACCVIFWFSMGTAFLVTIWPDDAGAQYLAVPPSGAQNPAVPTLESRNFIVLPTLTVSEEYNDNIFLTRYNKIDDYITRAIPAFSIDYKTPLWNWHLDAAYDYRYYAKGSKTGDSTYFVNLINHTVVINNLFFLDVLDKYDRTSLSTSRDFTTQSLFVNQTDENIFTVNPYFMLRSESRFTPILGYKYVNTWYKQPSAISTVDNIGYAEIITDLSSNMTFTIGAQYTQDHNKVEDYNRADVYAGPRYTYAPFSYIWFLIGESFFDFQFQGTERHVIWDAGFTHRYSTSTLAFQTKSEYIHDPERILRRVDSYVATISKETTRTSYAISAGLFEYRSAATNHLENSTDQLTGELKHALSPTLTLVLDETIQRLEDDQRNTSISLWESQVKLERKLMEKLTLTLGYSYTNSYSHNSYSDNYVNNRFEVALTMTF